MSGFSHLSPPGVLKRSIPILTATYFLEIKDDGFSELVTAPFHRSIPKKSDRATWQKNTEQCHNRYNSKANDQNVEEHFPFPARRDADEHH